MQILKLLCWTHVALVCSGLRFSGNITQLPNLAGIADTEIIIERTRITTLPDRAFQQVPHLTRLAIIHNVLTSVGQGTFDGLDVLTTLDLTNNSLSAVPNLSPVAPSLTNLILSQNLLAVLDVTSFMELPFLQAVSLDYNRISLIPDFPVAGSNALRYMDLSHNIITEIPLNAFHGLDLETLKLSYNAVNRVNQFSMPNMKVLNVDHNDIQTLPERLFEATILEKIDLSNNDLQEFPNVAMLNASLLQLSLQRSGISSIPKERFGNLSSLTKLDLRYNSLTRLENVTANRLRELYLDGNSLSDIPEVELTEMKSLITLSLDSNSFENIPHFPPAMRTLRTLKMAKNRISRFSPESFINTPLIQSINLNSNNLTEFPDVSNLQSLREIIVSENNLGSFSGHCVAGLQYFATLKLDANHFQTLPDVTEISHILLNLYINDNPIRDLDPQYLTRDIEAAIQSSAYVALQRLEVKACEVPEVSDLFLKVTKNLQYLILSACHIQRFPNLSLLNLTLKEVDLSNNYLDLIPASYLKQMKELTKLSVNGNHLKDFPFQNLAEMPKLTNVNLAENDFVRVPVLWQYDTRPVVLAVVFTANPIHCDMSMCWLIDPGPSTIKMTLSDKPCTLPENLSQKSFPELTYLDLHCEQAPDIASTVFKPQEGKLKWFRSLDDFNWTSVVTARSRADCARQCASKLTTWKLTGCTGFQYSSEPQDNCYLYQPFNTF